jgi:glycosyltransferase involved in cell wall biosynthesis
MSGSPVSPNNLLRSKLEKLGWRSLNESLWEKLSGFRSGIAILAPPLDTIPSPHGHAIYTIVQDLAERSPVPCLVLAIWPDQAEPQKCNISDRILYCQNPFQPVILENTIPYRVKRLLWGTSRPELLYYAKMAARLCKYLGVKTIVVEDVPRFGLAFKKKLGKGAKVFLHQHIDAPLNYKLIWWKWMRDAYDGMIFAAQKTLIDTEKLHGKLANPIVVYNGVDLGHYDPDRWKEKAKRIRAQYSILENELIVLYVGRIIPGKGCLELAQAFMQADVPVSRLVIAGDLTESNSGRNEFIIRLREIAEDSRKRIILAGSVPQIEIPAWYQAADLVVVPSLQSEGLPKVITEALVMGKPVLASDRGGALELVRPGQNGWLLENPEDIIQFSKQIKGILHDREKLVEFGRRAFYQDRPGLGIEHSSHDFFDFILRFSN